MTEVMKVEGGTALGFLSTARQAVEKAKSVQDLKEVRDQAEAVRIYARQAGESLAIQNHCAEVKLRAERKAGELLKEFVSPGRPRKNGDTMSPLPGAEPPQSGNPCAAPVTLKSLGVGKIESSRWQKEASVPEPVFEEFVRGRNEAREEITQAALLKIAEKTKKKPQPSPAKGEDNGLLPRLKRDYLKLSQEDCEAFHDWLATGPRRRKGGPDQGRLRLPESKRATSQDLSQAKDGEWEPAAGTSSLPSTAS